MADGLCKDDNNAKTKKSNNNTKNYNSTTTTANNIKRNEKLLQINLNKLNDCNIDKLCEKSLLNSTKITSLQQRSSLSSSSSTQSVSSAVASVSSSSSLSSSSLIDNNIKHLKTNNSNNKRDSNNKNSNNNNKNKMNNVVGICNGNGNVKNSQLTGVSSSGAAVSLAVNNVSKVTASTVSTTTTTSTSLSINHNNCLTTKELLNNNNNNNNNCKSGNVKKCNATTASLATTTTSVTNNNSTNLVSNIKNNNNNNKLSCGSISGSGLTTSVTNLNSNNLNNCVMISGNNNNNINNSGINGAKQQQQICNQGLSTITTSTASSSSTTSSKLSISGVTITPKTFPQPISVSTIKNCTTNFDLHNKMDKKCIGTSITKETGIKNSLLEQDTEDNRNKKKRCSDRYDSSESSDSGVATLSCTDSSTASSDASDPGSPYSPVSLGDDVHHQTATTQSSGKVNMPPQTILTSPPVAHQAHHHHSTSQQQQQQTSTLSSSSSSTSSVSSSPSSIVKHLQQHHQQLQHLTQKWPWNTTVTATTSITSNNNNNNNINNSNNFNANNNNNKSSNNNNIATGNKHKRLSINTSDTNNTAKKVRANSNNINSLNHYTSVVENNSKLNHQNTTTTTANSVAPSAAKRLKSSATSVIDDVSSTSLSSSSPSAQQTKITGYFKSQMKPLNGIKKDIPNTQQQQLNNQFNQPQQQQQQTSPLPPIPIGLDKYFNILTKNKDDKDQSQKLNSIKNYDVRNIQSTLPPSLKKIERKTTKIAQVAPNPRKTSSLRPKSPKKHIAIAPRTAEMKKTTNATARKLSASSTTANIHNQIEAQQAKISQPTVLLTAIRIPQANAQPAQVQTSSQTPTHHHQQTISAQKGITTTTPTVATATTTAAKVGSTQVFQIPVMPNLVQIPNILATNAGNLVMNNGQLARMGNGAQYFLNGTVIKLQQIVAPSNANDHNGNNNVNTNVLTMETGLQGNILVKQPTIAQAMPLTPASTGAAMSTTKSTTYQQTPIISHSQTPMNANGLSSATATITGIHHQGPNFSTSQRLSAQPVFMATTTGLLLNAATLPTAVIATAKLPGLPQVIPALQPIQSHTQNSATASILPNLSTILHSNTSTAQFIVNHSEPPALTSMSNTVTQLSSTSNGNFVTSKTIASVAGAQTSVVAANTMSSVPPPLVTLASTRDSASTAVTAGLMRQKLSSNNFISSDLKENSSTIATEKSSQLHLKLLSPPPLISTISGTEDASLHTIKTNMMTMTTTTLNAKEPILPQLVPTNDNHLHHPYVIDILKSLQQHQQQHQQPQQQQFLPPTLISTTSLSSLSSIVNNHNKSVEVKDSMKLCLPPSTKDNLITTTATITTTTTPTKLTVVPDALIYGKDEFVKFEKFNEKTFKKEEGGLKKENDDELLKNEIKCESMFDFDEELEHEVTKAAKIAAAVAAETLKDSDDFKIEEKLFKLESFKPEKFELGNIDKIKISNCIDTNHNDDDSSIKPISEESSLSNESCVDESQQSQSLTHQLLLDATQETNVTTVTLNEDITTTPTIITPIITDIEINNLSSSSFSLQKCAISPILSQPKTIRFPVINGDSKNRIGLGGVYRIGTKGAKRCHDGICYWDNCNEKYDTSSKLLDHLQQQHVNTQDGPFQCLWNGCKVHGRESCSRRWLERHVLSHGGTKPFKCIVDGCGLRFGSQLALQKHVNGHFNNVENKDNQSKRTSDPPVPKLLRKNGKKLRYRRQPFSARMFDFFDSGIMEGLQHRLMITGSLANGPKGSVTFKGQTIARRTTIDGVNEVFVRWNPYEIIPDEWVPESKNALTKTISIHELYFEERIALQKQLNHANLHKDINTIFNHKKSLISSSSLALSLSDDSKQIRRQKKSRKSSNISWSSTATPSSSSSSSSSSLSSSSSVSSFCSSASCSTPSQSSSSLFKLFMQQPS